MRRILLSSFTVTLLVFASGATRAQNYIYGSLNLSGLTTNGAIYYDGTKFTNTNNFTWNGTNVTIIGSSGTDRGTVYQNDVGTQATAGIGSTGSTCGINNYFVKTNAGCSLTIGSNGQSTFGAGGDFAGAVRESHGYTVAALPAHAAGQRAYVTDQLTACPAFGGTFTGGGTVVCPAFDNGTAWVSE